MSQKDRKLCRVWVEENWIGHVQGSRVCRPACRRFSRESALSIAGWLSGQWRQRYVVEDTETGDVFTIQSGQLL